MGKLTLVEQALRFHKEYYGDENFGTVVKDYDYYPKVAEIFINRKNKKIYSNLDIEPITSTVVHTGSSPVMAKTGRIKKLMFKDGSGAYRVHLGQNEVVHIIRFILNSKVRMEYAVGTSKSMSMLHNLCEAGCSGQLKLATVLEFFRYRFSDSLGGNPPLYSCGLSSL